MGLWDLSAQAVRTLVAAPWAIWSHSPICNLTGSCGHRLRLESRLFGWRGLAAGRGLQSLGRAHIHTKEAGKWQEEAVRHRGQSETLRCLPSSRTDPHSSLERSAASSGASNETPPASRWVGLGWEAAPRPPAGNQGKRFLTSWGSSVKCVWQGLQRKTDAGSHRMFFCSAFPLSTLQPTAQDYYLFSSWRNPESPRSLSFDLSSDQPQETWESKMQMRERKFLTF